MEELQKLEELNNLLTSALSEYKMQAERWATRYGNKGYVNKYDYVPNAELKYLKFDTMTEEWLDFIVACRLGKSHTFDIVEGPMADDAIFNYVQNFIDKKISRAAFWRSDFADSATVASASDVLYCKWIVDGVAQENYDKALRRPSAKPCINADAPKRFAPWSEKLASPIA